MTREEAIDCLNGIKIYLQTEHIDIEAVDMAIEALQTIDNCDQCEWCCPSNGIPTIHAVRCKDCKHYQNEHICQYFSRFGTIETSAHAYCAYGERREL